MTRVLTALSIVAASLPGCGGGGASGTTLYRGSAEAEPSMEALPAADVRHEELSERMRFAWVLAEESFEVEAPAVPERVGVAQLQTWADEQLGQWLEVKNERVVAARQELDSAAEESHRQRIIAGAVVGLLYEDVARVLLHVPVPEDLESEPEIADVYRSIIAFQARPYVEHARRAYRACALNAAEPETMRHWSSFCAARAERLPRGAEEALASGETDVTVFREPD